ncbi:hypothetical protein Leryth_017095 [Lithospermum erythrorhizon]|uniref:BURP domain-containing protein n=1 Tax=Lithospermum erythrorhizon TaxID=34254 RepID=A0AAV3QXP2_LITER|nr:hypothetical protein Leryth_017095 [Lithospermum erythrorhizon]
MKSQLRVSPPIVLFLSLIFVASHALRPAELYWRSLLNNAPIPKAIKVLIDPGTIRNLNNNGGGDASIKEQDQEEPDNSNCFSYTIPYCAPAPPNSRPTSTSLFFLPKDLKSGTKKSLHFPKSLDTSQSILLPRHLSDEIPFSSTILDDILKVSSIVPNSRKAKEMRRTIAICEAPGTEGEQKSCVSSLESMIDFSITSLGKNVEAVSTDVDDQENEEQKYNVVGVKKIGNKEAVVCHKQKYPYAIFYCHKAYNIKAYKVLLVGEDENKVKAIAICHQDTSKWTPEHLAFKVLKVKPGSVPICHFLPEDHIVWINKQKYLI